MKNGFFCIALCLGLVACSTLVDKGDDLYEAGMYQEAASFYEKALAKKPNDVNATLGLARAHNKIIDQGLIDVRMLRLASNFSGAATRLETLMSNQNTWNVQSSGAMWVTQEEEIREAERWLSRRAEELTTSPYPDRFRWFQYRFPYLLANAEIEGELAGYEAGLLEAGQARCDELAAQVRGQRFFLKKFTEKYCLAWGKSVVLRVDDRDTSRYGDIHIRQNWQLDMSDRSAQETALHGLTGRMQQQFQGSPWFTPLGSQRVDLDLRAVIAFRRSANPVNRSRKYQVTKVRKDPKNDDKLYKVTADRIHSYRAVVYKERYAAQVTYQGSVDGHPLQHSIGGSQTNVTESHDEHFAAANLSPQPPQFLNTETLLAAYLRQLREDFGADLDRLWRYTYCEQHIAESSGENVLRCGKVDPDHAYVNTWSKQHFGVDYRAMAALYGM